MAWFSAHFITFYSCVRRLPAILSEDTDSTHEMRKTKWKVPYLVVMSGVSLVFDKEESAFRKVTIFFLTGVNNGQKENKPQSAGGAIIQCADTAAAGSAEPRRDKTYYHPPRCENGPLLQLSRWAPEYQHARHDVLGS